MVFSSCVVYYFGLTGAIKSNWWLMASADKSSSMHMPVQQHCRGVREYTGTGTSAACKRESISIISPAN